MATYNGVRGPKGLPGDTGAPGQDGRPYYSKLTLAEAVTYGAQSTNRIDGLVLDKFPDSQLVLVEALILVSTENKATGVSVTLCVHRGFEHPFGAISMGTDRLELTSLSAVQANREPTFSRSDLGNRADGGEKETVLLRAAFFGYVVGGVLECWVKTGDGPVTVHRNSSVVVSVIG